MNRILAILSGVSFLAIVVMITLVSFGAINPINWLKYLVLFCSAFLTFFSLGIFIRKNELSKVLTIFIVFLLIIPCLIALLGIFKPEIITNFWKLFIGGSIFQIGTGIFVLAGGFIRRDGKDIFQLLNIVNYVVFLFLALIIVFSFTELMNRNLLIVLGVILSVLSLLLVFFKRRRRA